jgi:hypothetical protein
MGHKIEKPHDVVLSLQGTEWHGLADHVAVIGQTEIAPLLFDIVESPAFVVIGGQQIQLESYKVLVADHRTVRPELPSDEQLVPLHIPREGYKVISNREIWETMEKALKDLGCKVTSACTLERGKKFALSCDIGGSDSVVCGDKFKSLLNFVTSHDGSMAMETFDSNIRIVCMNTLQWSRNQAADKFKVYHTKNAALALDGLADLLQATLQGRAELAQVFSYLSDHKCDNNDALAMAAGYFCIQTDAKENKLSTRAMNAATDIARLFAHGIGNRGASLYDLANGGTEYWTHGDGAGRTGTLASKVYRSQLGSAADHKHRFVHMLADDSDRAVMLSRGKEAVKAGA